MKLIKTLEIINPIISKGVWGTPRRAIPDVPQGHEERKRRLRELLAYHQYRRLTQP